MAQVYERTTEDLKKDVEELTNIAIEDKISWREMMALHQLTENPGSDAIDRWLNQKVLASEISGESLISKRFADKMIQRSHEILDESRLGKKTCYPIKLML